MRYRPLVILVPLLGIVGAPGCASSIKDSQMRVVTAPPAAVRSIAIEVNTDVPDLSAVPEAARYVEEYRAHLRACLRDEFAALGYQVDAGGLVVKATITKLHFGDTAANVTFGLGIGKDTIDVGVELSDAAGAPYMTFAVHGAAVDKRYSDLHGVTRGVAKKIAEDVKRASR